MDAPNQMPYEKQYKKKSSIEATISTLNGKESLFSQGRIKVIRYLDYDSQWQQSDNYEVTKEIILWLEVTAARTMLKGHSIRTSNKDVNEA